MISLLKLFVKLLIISWFTAKRQLIHENTAQRSAWNQYYDYIIVGAGTAGCAVANRLAENGRSTVLLLEAGGAQDAIFTDIPTQYTRITEKRPQIQWDYYSETQRNVGKQFLLGRVSEIRGKMIGGSSSHNAMLYVRGNPRDFDRWEQEFGAKGWSFRHVLPYFKKFENNTNPSIVAMNPGYHGTNGPVQISSPRTPRFLIKIKEVFNSFDFHENDFNGANQTGKMFAQHFFGQNGLRSSSGSAYIDPNPYPKNLHIVTKALVSRIIFKELRAVGVEFIRNDTKYFVKSRKEIIISAGAINTPQILMLSGIGLRDHLKKLGMPVLLNLPVGDNYKNHPDVYISDGAQSPIRLDYLTQFYLNKTGPLSRRPELMVYFSTKTNKDKKWPNFKINLLAHPFKKSISSVLLEMLKIRSIGTIRLQSASPYDPPLITSNFLSDPKDFEDMVEATKIAFYFLSLPRIAPFAPIHTFESVGCPSCPGIKDYNCDSGIRCFVQYSTISSWHAGGSCRMGATGRTDVVVGPDLIVKQTKNLRVCDASIFPDLPNANTNAAANMVGEKCADLVKSFLH